MSTPMSQSSRHRSRASVGYRVALYAGAGVGLAWALVAMPTEAHAAAPAPVQPPASKVAARTPARAASPARAAAPARASKPQPTTRPQASIPVPPRKGARPESTPVPTRAGAPVVSRAMAQRRLADANAASAQQRVNAAHSAELKQRVENALYGPKPTATRTAKPAARPTAKPTAKRTPTPTPPQGGKNTPRQGPPHQAGVLQRSVAARQIAASRYARQTRDRDIALRNSWKALTTPKPEGRLITPARTQEQRAATQQRAKIAETVAQAQAKMGSKWTAKDRQKYADILTAQAQRAKDAALPKTGTRQWVPMPGDKTGLLGDWLTRAQVVEKEKAARVARFAVLTEYNPTAAAAYRQRQLRNASETPEQLVSLAKQQTMTRHELAMNHMTHLRNNPKARLAVLASVPGRTISDKVRYGDNRVGWTDADFPVWRPLAKDLAEQEYLKNVTGVTLCATYYEAHGTGGSGGTKCSGPGLESTSTKRGVGAVGVGLDVNVEAKTNAPVSGTTYTVSANVSPEQLNYLKLPAAVRTALFSLKVPKGAGEVSCFQAKADGKTTCTVQAGVGPVEGAYKWNDSAKGGTAAYNYKWLKVTAGGTYDSKKGKFTAEAAAKLGLPTAPELQAGFTEEKTEVQFVDDNSVLENGLIAIAKAGGPTMGYAVVPQQDLKTPKDERREAMLALEVQKRKEQLQREDQLAAKLRANYAKTHPGNKIPSDDELLVDLYARTHGINTDSPAYRNGGRKRLAVMLRVDPGPPNTVPQSPRPRSGGGARR